MRPLAPVLALLLASQAGCGPDPSSKASDLGVTWWLDEDVESLVHVAWEQPSAATTRIAYALDGEDEQSTPERRTEAGPNEAFIAGVPYDSSFSFTIVYDVAEGRKTEAERADTGPAPTGLPLPALLTNDDARVGPTGRFLLGSLNADEGGWVPGQYWLFILDRQGRLVWALPGEGDDFTIEVRVSKDNDILQDVSGFWNFGGDRSASAIRRIGLFGETSASYDVPWLFNPFCELPDGSLVWGALSPEEMLIMRRFADGSSAPVWSCAPFGPEDVDVPWCRTNSIEYDEPTNRFLVSFPLAFPTVMEIDAETGESIRWFGPLADGWGFDPPDSAFIMPHGVTWTPERTLLVSSQESAKSTVGVIREYVVDEDDETLRLIWSQGEGSGIEAELGGGAERLPGGNTLHWFGTTPRAQEVTPDGDVVWDVAWEGERLLGRVGWLEDLYALNP